MADEFPDLSAPPAAAQPPAPVAPPQPDAPQPDTASTQADVLAGALPGWDLLPSSPFVRRVR